MKKKKSKKNNSELVKKLQNDVFELRQLLDSIKSGEVDALVIKNKMGDESIFTLEGEDQPYRTLIENLSEGAVTLDADGKIIHCNKKFSLMVNQPINNIIGHTIFNYIPESQHQKLKDIFNRDKRVSQVEFTLLVTAKINKVVLLSCNTMKFGNIDGLSVVVTDITRLYNEYTQRIYAQKELVKQENLFRQFAEIINDVFWIMTPEMDKLTYVSPAYEKIWGRSLKSLYANPMEWKESIVEEDKDKVEEFLNKLLYQKSAFTNYTIFQPDGEEKIIFVKGFQNTNANGEIINILGIAADITELTHLQNQAHLDDKLRMVGILGASVAHEINNPIAWVKSNLSYIKVNAAKIDSIQLNQLMDESIDGVNRVIDIVQSLKGFAKINDNETTLVDLKNILDSALKIALYEIKTHGVHVEKNYDNSIPLIRGNSGKLQQVFLNLIMNAVQAMATNDHKSILSISTIHENTRARIDVSDTGPGIDPKNLSKIFEPFFTTKGKTIGTGLGLSISNEIVKNSGGEIKVKSELGTRTTFSVYLPINNEIIPSELNNTVSKTETSPLSRTRILVVDDEINLLKSIKRLLEERFDVSIAHGSKAAMDLLQTPGMEFDVILTDLNMPEISGIELYDLVLKKYPQMQDRIIFMTGSLSNSSIINFISSNAIHCLEKPFDQEFLVKQIEKIENKFKK